MELQELYALIERFQSSGLTRLEWKREDGEKLVLAREQPPIVTAGGSSLPTSPFPTDAKIAETSEIPQSPELGDVVTAPLVGVFYAAPSPDSEPFVTQGKHVKKGETLCILEAMKMMSEVPAPADCVIEEVLAEDAKPVGYGDALFRIRRV